MLSTLVHIPDGFGKWCVLWLVFWPLLIHPFLQSYFPEPFNHFPYVFHGKQAFQPFSGVGAITFSRLLGGTLAASSQKQVRIISWDVKSCISTKWPQVKKQNQKATLLYPDLCSSHLDQAPWSLMTHSDAILQLICAILLIRPSIFLAQMCCDVCWCPGVEEGATYCLLGESP